MSAEPRAPIAILWHMHQPEYRIAGVPALPWAYLHGLRAYTDMASHLEAVPGACAVINFSPVLLEQLADLAGQAQAALAQGTTPAEPLMAALLTPPAAEQREHLLECCLRGHERNAHHRYDEYFRLAADVTAALESGPDAIAALSEQQVIDMVVWYHLTWLGESVRRGDPRAAALLAQRRNFSGVQCRGLLELVAELLGTIVPRYRRLAESGQAELCMSPYFHPILPLLLSFDCAHETAPGVSLPNAAYPGGRERALWHLRAGRDYFRKTFGVLPRGCWPSEAAVSQATAELLQQAGFEWLASSQSVLQHSLQRSGGGEIRSCAWRLHGSPMTGFFRDDGLSDNIGFVYKDWQAQHAVADLVHHLEALSHQRHGGLVVLALDGENPWEYYADNGIDFVRGLYAALANHPHLCLSTFAGFLDEAAAAPPDLNTLAAGSWVHGQLLTWIGSSGKNQAWELLVEAKRRFDATPEPSAAAQHALGACEGSDWFWWPGMPHPGAAVAEFDQLFRAHLRHLYHCLDAVPPALLDHPLSFEPSDTPTSAPLGAMLPNR